MSFYEDEKKIQIISSPKEERYSKMIQEASSEKEAMKADLILLEILLAKYKDSYVVKDFLKKNNTNTSYNSNNYNNSNNSYKPKVYPKENKPKEKPKEKSDVDSIDVKQIKTDIKDITTFTEGVNNG